MARPLPERAREAAKYLREERLPEVEGRWRDVTGGEPAKEVEIHLHVPTERATSAGLTLYDVDRELRRAAALVPAARGPDIALADEKAARAAFQPVATSRGGLNVDATEKGSLEFILHGYGVIEAFLVSQPVAAAVALRELLGWTGRIRVLFRRRHQTRSKVVYDESPGGWFEVGVGPANVRVDGEIPPNTRVVFRTVSAAGDETQIEIERGK